MPNYIALAVPFFFALIGVEVWLARRRGQDVYRFNDAVSDLSAGIFQQVSLIFSKGLLIAVYAWAYQARVIDLSPKSVLTWLAAIVLVDFFYYWWHRLSHEVNFLWAAHVVHHSSEEYNLAVALRQGVFTPFTITPFHLPMALLGIPPLVMVAVDSFNTLYQFWIHTRLIGRLGFLEKWINTPMLHRVHHAINPRYLDKNYGGTFIVFDRLFGTYIEESEPAVYGLVKPLADFQPLSAQFHYFGSIWGRLKINGWRAIFQGPAAPPSPPPPEVSPATFVKHDPPLAVPLMWYIFVQLAFTIAGATLLMFGENTLPMATLAGGALLVYLALIGWGALLEGRAWGAWVELARLVLCVGFAARLLAQGSIALPAALGAGLLALGSAGWLLRATRPPAAVSSAS